MWSNYQSRNIPECFLTPLCYKLKSLARQKLSLDKAGLLTIIFVGCEYMCTTGRQGRDRPDTWLGYMPGIYVQDRKTGMVRT